MNEPPSFTQAVRQELASQPLGAPSEVVAELAAVVRHGGSLTLAGGVPGHVGIEVATTSGAVVRRVFGALQQRFDVRPQILVRAAGGVHRRATYHVRLGPDADGVARALGLVDARGRPRDALPGRLSARGRVAYVRGAFLGGGSLSAPGRPPHLEVAAGSQASAATLAELVRDIVGGTVAVTGPTPRVVLKSGERIGELLATIGATQAFLDWDDRRLRRQLRSDANRLANADRANLRRTIDAAGEQVRRVEDVLSRVGWDAIADDLRAVALARLANPEASLAELGQLLDPPVGKSAVHRRLRRLESLAADEDAVAPDDVGPADEHVAPTDDHRGGGPGSFAP